ncbi:MAG: dTDP-fucosamine acetyltransferase [Bacteroidetes bacterium ADurb.Bin174]|nr:MAG: dTDP-fucosamine acetyltransferase [Bacteroidetes bacterium ADurb.Bin174]
MKLEHLSWDSNFFDIKVGRITLNCSENDIQALLEDAKNRNYQLVYVFTNKETELTSDVLNWWSGKLVDRKIIYKKDISSNIKEESLILSYSRAEINDELLHLAYLSGQFSRFRLDKKFPEGSFERMYKEWLKKSVSGELADKVFVAKEAGKIVGFVTLKINKNNGGNIGLIAVDKNVQGKGLGTQLINACENYLNNNFIKILRVPAQLENFQACRFYEKYGFKEDNITNIYHFWI